MQSYLVKLLLSLKSTTLSQAETATTFGLRINCTLFLSTLIRLARAKELMEAHQISRELFLTEKDCYSR